MRAIRKVALAVDPAVVAQVGTILNRRHIRLGDVVSQDERLRCYDATTPYIAPVPRPTVSPDVRLLQLIAAGKTNLAIAREMGCTRAHVENHIRSVRRRLKARDRAHAVAIGYRTGLLAGVA